jgi:hypothetical protein
MRNEELGISDPYSEFRISDFGFSAHPKTI